MLRYLVFALGLLAISIGMLISFVALMERAAFLIPIIQAIVLAGVIAASVGAATIDIVNAINSSKNRDRERAPSSEPRRDD